MRAKIGPILLLVFQAFWLNVVLPGHTRGVVTLAGANGGSCHVRGGDRCCPTSKSSDNDQESREKRASRCAICFFAVRLTAPPPVDLTPPALELLERAPAPRAESVEFIAPRPAYFGRAPPLA